MYIRKRKKNDKGRLQAWKKRFGADRRDKAARQSSTSFSSSSSSRLDVLFGQVPSCCLHAGQGSGCQPPRPLEGGGGGSKRRRAWGGEATQLAPAGERERGGGGRPARAGRAAAEGRRGSGMWGGRFFFCRHHDLGLRTNGHLLVAAEGTLPRYFGLEAAELVVDHRPDYFIVLHLIAFALAPSFIYLALPVSVCGS